MIIYNKLDNDFFVSADRQTFLGFEMTANLRDNSTLRTVAFFASAHKFCASQDGTRNPTSLKGEYHANLVSFQNPKILV